MLTFKQKVRHALTQFKFHFINQFRPRYLWNAIKCHALLLASFIVAISIGIAIAVVGLPFESFKNVYSAWTFVTLGHLSQAIAAIVLPHSLTKRILKIPFHGFIATLTFLYWLKMGDWMHFGYHHFLYASIALFYMFERLGKSVAIVIGIPLAISDIVGYGEFPIFHKPTNLSGLDNVLKKQPWVFIVPVAILFVCELIIEGPVVQSYIDVKNLPQTEEEELLII